MLDTVHKSNGNLFPVLAHIIFRLRDITFHPRDSEVLRHPADHLTRVVAQVAAGTAKQRDTGDARTHSATVPLQPPYLWPGYWEDAHSGESSHGGRPGGFGAAGPEPWAPAYPPFPSPYC